MRVTILNMLDGTSRVHKHGCRDIQRDAHHANGHYALDAETRDDVVRDIWQDIIREREAENRYAAEQGLAADYPDVMSGLEDEVIFLPCLRLETEGEAK